MPNELIYLDHAAATPVDPLVVDAMMPYLTEKFYNPSSPYAEAVAVKREYAEAKARIAAVIGVQADELVMTAGATESINIAATVSSKAAVSAIEHVAVLKVASQSDGLPISANEKGIVTPEAVKQALTPDVDFVSVGLVNNELGVVQPLEEIVRVVEAERDRRRVSGETTPLYVHSDASQALALLDVKPKRLGIDLLTLSAAKVYGPKQVGLLWVRPGVKVSSTVEGGGQELGLRGGTENVAGVVAFALAAELAAKRRGAEVKRLRGLRDSMQNRLQKEFPDMIVSSSAKKGLTSFLHVSFPGLDAERLIFWLEVRGVMLATGSACAANKGTKSHVLGAIGMSDEAIGGSLRISLGKLSTKENIERATELIVEAVKQEKERLA